MFTFKKITIFFFFFYFENIDCPIKVGRTALVREENRNVAVVNNCPNMIKENIFIFSFSFFSTPLSLQSGVTQEEIPFLKSQMQLVKIPPIICKTERATLSSSLPFGFQDSFLLYAQCC